MAIAVGNCTPDHHKRRTSLLQVFYVGFDGPMDLLWAKPARQGVQWAREADLKAAAAPWAPPSL